MCSNNCPSLPIQPNQENPWITNVLSMRNKDSWRPGPPEFSISRMLTLWVLLPGPTSSCHRDTHDARGWSVSIPFVHPTGRQQNVSPSPAMPMGSVMIIRLGGKKSVKINSSHLKKNMAKIDRESPNNSRIQQIQQLHTYKIKHTIMPGSFKLTTSCNIPWGYRMVPEDTIHD